MPMPPPDQRQASARVGGLDGVRALAVLAVLAFHEGLSWLPGGFLGVDVFFVLSGYLITDLLAARFSRDGRVGLSSFWIRRARRLLPALAAMLVIVTAAVAIWEPDQMPALRPALTGAVTYTSNWWQALAHQTYFQMFGPPPVLQHLWSLAVEEQFYLIWPLALTGLLIGVPNGRLRPLIAWAGAATSALLMLAMYVPGADPSLVYYGTDTHASALMIGAALALTWPLASAAKTSGRLLHYLDGAGLLALVVLAWSIWHFSGSDPALYPFGLVLAALAAGALVLAAAAPGRIGSALSSRPLRWIGVRSYGIYLWHWPVIAIAAALAGRVAVTVPYRFMTAALPIGIAALSWRFLEQPILGTGLIAVARDRRDKLAALLTGFRRTRTHKLRLTGAAAAGISLLAVIGTAGYGLLTSYHGLTLQEQIAAGARVSARTQAARTQAVSTAWTPAPGDLGAAWRPRVGVGAPPVAHRRPPISGWRVLAIGDSVMLASAPEMQRAIPGIHINAVISRQMSDGVDLVRRLARSGRLRSIVIVGLGTNGTVTMDQIRALRSAIGRRWLILINVYVPRSWEHEVNRTIETAAARFGNVLMVNWQSAIEQHTNLLWSDGVHPQPPGGTLYARVLRAVVVRALQHHAP